jgi:hypothetical protein
MAIIHQMEVRKGLEGVRAPAGGLPLSDITPAPIRAWNAHVCTFAVVAGRAPVASRVSDDCRAARAFRVPLVIDFDGGPGVRVGLHIRSRHR